MDPFQAAMARYLTSRRPSVRNNEPPEYEFNPRYEQFREQPEPLTLAEAAERYGDFRGMYDRSYDPGAAETYRDWEHQDAMADWTQEHRDYLNLGEGQSPVVPPLNTEVFRPRENEPEQEWFKRWLGYVNWRRMPLNLREGGPDDFPANSGLNSGGATPTAWDDRYDTMVDPDITEDDWAQRMYEFRTPWQTRPR